MVLDGEVARLELGRGGENPWVFVTEAEGREVARFEFSGGNFGWRGVEGVDGSVGFAVLVRSAGESWEFSRNVWRKIVTWGGEGRGRWPLKIFELSLAKAAAWPWREIRNFVVCEGVVGAPV